MAYRGGAEQRPRQTRWCDKRNSAAKDSIEAGARGLRRTAVVRAPRATSTPPRAAPPRLASYNGTGGGTVGRASRARLSTPRQPTPLLSGTCLTSAGRPPLRGMLATEGPGHPEGYPGPVEARYALSELRRIPTRRSSENSNSTHLGEYSTFHSSWACGQ